MKTQPNSTPLPTAYEAALASLDQAGNRRRKPIPEDKLRQNSPTVRPDAVAADPTNSAKRVGIAALLADTARALLASEQLGGGRKPSPRA